MLNLLLVNTLEALMDKLMKCAEFAKYLELEHKRDRKKLIDNSVRAHAFRRATAPKIMSNMSDPWAHYESFIQVKNKIDRSTKWQGLLFWGRQPFDYGFREIVGCKLGQ